MIYSLQNLHRALLPTVWNRRRFSDLEIDKHLGTGERGKQYTSQWCECSHLRQRRLQLNRPVAVGSGYAWGLKCCYPATLIFASQAQLPNNRKKVDIMIQIMTAMRNMMAPTCWITVTGWSDVEPSAYSTEECAVIVYAARRLEVQDLRPPTA